MCVNCNLNEPGRTRSIVFAAIERFARRLRTSLGLVMKPSAYGCYSMGHDLTVCPFRGDIPIGVLDGEMVTDGEYLGIVVGGAPIGTDGFMGAGWARPCVRRGGRW